MARIKIAKPQSECIHTFNFVIPINMINYGGHMGNDSFLTLAQETRLDYMKTHDFNELNFYGTSLIQADSAITYKQEIFHKDELEIDLYIEDITKLSFDFVFMVKKKQDQSEVARIKTGMLFFDYEKKKVTNAPEDFLNAHKLS